MPTHKAQNTISRCIQEHTRGSGTWDGAFHPILFDITQWPRNTSGAALSHDLASHKIMIPTMTPSMSLFKDSKHRKHQENGTEPTVQQRPPTRPVSLTHVTLQISNTIQQTSNFTSYHWRPMETHSTSSPATENGSSSSQASYDWYHLIRTPLLDTLRIPHAISRFTGHHPAGRRKRKPQGCLTNDKRETQVPTMASPLPSRYAVCHT